MSCTSGMRLVEDHEITEIAPYCFCSTHNHTRTAERMKLKCHFKNNLQRLKGLSAHRIPVLHDPFICLATSSFRMGSRRRKITSIFHFFHWFQCLLWIRHMTTMPMFWMTQNNPADYYKSPRVSRECPSLQKKERKKKKDSITQISNCLSKTIFPSQNDSISVARVIWPSPRSRQTVARGNAKEAAGCSLMWFHFSRVIWKKDCICMQKRKLQRMTQMRWV